MTRSIGYHGEALKGPWFHWVGPHVYNILIQC